ncbi:hypothetical protein AX16_008760 [Volvariella volvacea WC 439]|nr:hypothetical protein AX16_008760 [Volvariella volvacea WC 439]
MSLFDSEIRPYIGAGWGAPFIRLFRDLLGIFMTRYPAKFLPPTPDELLLLNGLHPDAEHDYQEYLNVIDIAIRDVEADRSQKRKNTQVGDLSTTKSMEIPEPLYTLRKQVVKCDIGVNTDPIVEPGHIVRKRSLSTLVISEEKACMKKSKTLARTVFAESDLESDIKLEDAVNDKRFNQQTSMLSAAKQKPGVPTGVIAKTPTGNQNREQCTPEPSTPLSVASLPPPVDTITRQPKVIKIEDCDDEDNPFAVFSLPTVSDTGSPKLQFPLVLSPDLDTPNALPSSLIPTETPTQRHQMPSLMEIFGGTSSSTHDQKQEKALKGTRYKEE